MKMRNCSLLAVAAVLAALPVAFAAEKLPVDAAPSVAGAVQNVELFKRLVTDLAAPEMEGRGPGTAGLDRARDYLVEEFKKLGLQPAFKQENGERGYTQAFEISAGIRAKEINLVILGKDGKPALTPKVGEQYDARGFSGDGDVTATPVFVGYGAVNAAAHYDSYAGLAKDQLKGKVAVAFRYEPVDDKGNPKLIADGKAGRWGEASSLLNKAKWAAERGAVALVVVDPPAFQKSGAILSVAASQGSPVAIPVVQISPDVFRFMLREAGLGDESAAKRLEKEANAGATEIRPLAPLKMVLKVDMQRTKAKVHNVAAVLPGAGELKDQYIVIGGHYDHLGFGDMGSLSRSGKSEIHHGADDNASGTAGVLLAAMQLSREAKAAAANTAPANRRSVLFVFFTGEERGLLGSAHMLRNPDELGIKLEQMTVMLNMDMTGRMDGNKLIAAGAGSGDRFDPIIQAAAKPINLHVHTDTAGMGIGGSDHQSFHAKKIPAVHFFTGVHVDYHKPSDTADKINAEGGAKVADLVARITQSLWTGSDTIKFQTVRIAHPATGGPRGGGPFLGIIPNYASLDAETGCAIDGTTPGSPADQAGLKANDIITAWNDESIKNLRDLSAALGKSKAGDDVTLKITRDKKELELKVKIGTRG